MNRCTVEELPGRIRIHLQTNWLLRLLGLPFLAIGVFFVYNIIAGIVDIVRAPGHDDLLTLLPGQLIGLLFALAFGLPGWLMVVARKSITIDVARRQVEERLNLLVYSKTKLHPIDAFKEVATVYDKSESHDRQTHAVTVTIFYAVHLIRRNNTSPLLVYLAEKPADALTLGPKIAAALHLPFVNAIQETQKQQDQSEDPA